MTMENKDSINVDEN